MAEEEKPASSVPPSPSPSPSPQGPVMPGFPPEVQQKFSEITMAMGYAGPLPNPLLAKLTPEHLTIIIEKADSQDKRQSKYNFWYFVIPIIVVVGLIVYLTQLGRDSLVAPIIQYILTFAAGLAGGYGLGLKSKK